MKESILDRVIKLANVNCPLEQPTEKNWAILEDELQIALPTDLKELVSRLGSGLFGELLLLNPCSSSPYGKFSRENAMDYAECIAVSAKIANIKIYPEDGGYIQVAAKCGHKMDLLIKPIDRRNYKSVWMDQDLDVAYEIDRPIPQFIHDLYFNKLTESWTHEVRKLTWTDHSPFFESRPGSYK